MSTDKGITRENLSQELNDFLDSLGGGGGVMPSNLPPTTYQWGAINPGTDLSDKPIVDIVKMACMPYQPASIDQFTASKTVFEAGTSGTGINITIKVTKKSNPITNIQLYDGSTILTTFSNVSNGGTFTYTLNGVNANKTLKVVASDGTQSVNKTLTLSFVNPMYVGIASQPLTKLIKAKSNHTYSGITCTNDKVVFKYDASYGNLTSIKDSNNFENLPAFVKTTEVINGVTYTVYTSGAATLNNFTYIFNF